MQNIKVEIKADAISKISKASPAFAIAELIWNALDADATKVEISIVKGETRVEEVIIKDNGKGFSYDNAPILFKSLGGSWKKNSSTTPIYSRFLHGKEGRGRFKALAIGAYANWEVRFKGKDKSEFFNISTNADIMTNFTLSDLSECTEESFGVEVAISELSKPAYWENLDELRDSLIQIFAPYLNNYPDIEIVVDNIPLKISDIILNQTDELLGEFNIDGKSYGFNIEIIEWDKIQTREYYLCNEHGIPLSKFTFKGAKGVGEFSFTAFIKSKCVSDMNSSGDLDLVHQSGLLEEVFEKLRAFLKDHFIKRTIAGSKSIIDKWKQDAIYPYSEDTEEKVDIAERQMFDILALNINSLMKSFADSPNEIKSFQFRMLKQTIEKSPKDLRKIIEEVIKLPKEKKKELEELLEDNDLTSIITMSKMVSDRIKFVSGIEELIFNYETRKLLKERSQLHKILADNAWFFGNEFQVAVSDKSLTEVLRVHRKLLGCEIDIDGEAVKRLDGKVGIIDLMLSRDIPKNHESEREHLIIELKAPKVKIGKEEVDQIISYADAISEDARFKGLNVKWNLLLVSTEVDSTAEKRRRQLGREFGIVHDTELIDGGRMTVWVKTWSEIINGCKHRMKYIKDSLDMDFDATNGVEYLQKKYAEYLQGVILD